MASVADSNDLHVWQPSANLLEDELGEGERGDGEEAGGAGAGAGGGGGEPSSKKQKTTVSDGDLE